MPTHSTLPVPRARPASTGMAPARPPHTTDQAVRRFNQIVYTKTLKNKPAKTMAPKSKSIISAQPTPRTESVMPNTSASLGDIFPDGSGRQQVRFMRESISRSYHILSTVLPLIARNRLPATPSIVGKLIQGQRELMNPARPVIRSSKVCWLLISDQWSFILFLNLVWNVLFNVICPERSGSLTQN